MPVSPQEFSVLSLNVKGIRNLRNRKQNYTWLKDHNVNNSVIFLQETHSDVHTQKQWAQD